MLNPVVLFGAGEMAGVFARGLLKRGHPLIPITRGLDPAPIAAAYPAPALVLVTVGEADLDTVLQRMPEAWRGRLALLQNELLPRSWQAHSIDSPTVISVWFEKKKGQEHKVIIPSPVQGAAAELLGDALATLDIPTVVLDDESALLFELVRKNLYILTTNIAGLALPAGTTVGALWGAHQTFARAVASDVLDIQFQLIGETLDREALIAGFIAALEGDPGHVCTGRSAPARLARALQHADEASLPVHALQGIAEAQSRDI